MHLVLSDAWGVTRRTIWKQDLPLQYANAKSGVSTFLSKCAVSIYVATAVRQANLSGAVDLLSVLLLMLLILLLLCLVACCLAADAAAVSCC